MKIQIASDLHLEMYRDNYPTHLVFRPVADRDVLVLGGDIGTHTNALRFVQDEARISPVILIPGNHEYYSVHSRHETDYAWRQIAESTPGLHYLVSEGVTIDGVRFWGAPWYSDLRGRCDQGHLYLIKSSLSDFSPRFNDGGAWTVLEHLGGTCAANRVSARAGRPGGRGHHALAADPARHGVPLPGQRT